VPRLCELYPGICLKTDEKAQKTLRVPIEDRQYFLGQ
jgi:flagellar motor switch protein FliM